MPDVVVIDRPGRPDTRITVYQEIRDGESTRPTQVYDGRDGGFIAERPGIGRVPSTGGTLYGLMGPLHFGDIAGLLSKAVWAALGCATCFVIVSGLRLWLGRRDLAQPAWAILDRLTCVAALAFLGLADPKRRLAGKEPVAPRWRSIAPLGVITAGLFVLATAGIVSLMTWAAAAIAPGWGLSQGLATLPAGLRGKGDAKAEDLLLRLADLDRTDDADDADGTAAVCRG